MRKTRIENKRPEIDPLETGALLKIKGLTPEKISFIMKMKYEILPTCSRLHRMNLKGSPDCDLCGSGAEGDLCHSLTECQHFGIIGDWMLGVLIDIDDSLVNVELSGEKLVSFTLPMERETELPIVWFLATVFQLLWEARTTRKPITVSKMKPAIQAELTIMKKTKFYNSAQLIENAISFISY